MAVVNSFSFIPILFFICVILIAVIIALAASKRLNVLLWSLLSAGGTIFLSVIVLIIRYLRFVFGVNRIFREVHHGYLNEHAGFQMTSVSIFDVLITLLPIFYLIVLLIIVLLKPKGQVPNKQLVSCRNCGSQIQQHVTYCPYCGETTRRDY